MRGYVGDTKLANNLGRTFDYELSNLANSLLETTYETPASLTEWEKTVHKALNYGGETIGELTSPFSYSGRAKTFTKLGKTAVDIMKDAIDAGLNTYNNLKEKLGKKEAAKKGVDNFIKTGGLKSVSKIFDYNLNKVTNSNTIKKTSKFLNDSKDSYLSDKND